MEIVPLPTDPHEQQREIMRRAHFTFEAAFRNILKLLTDPPCDDLRNFLGYCKVWCRALIEHHDAEETVIFPFLQRKLDFAEELLQHKELYEAIDAFLENITVFTSEEIRDWSESQTKYYMNHPSFATGLSFLRSHTPPEHKSWPPLPWPVEKFLLPLIAMRHSGYWKYLPLRELGRSISAGDV
ncbi:hypothetical protein POJ06DRAFT_282186 [Lipomyces tetrasporus]|uniref:Hemerythrin-like domain-containing protein n=1 Tax=Lipomyces tetrasporus TaxID=54092 RepID=A0AAD7QP61_9ASCO|nr:uncharacterized protein POJ06DRAFT_282186 [Lipomyces tetrasporus]KAJ8099027.1 hypothetical protein POJ06DRAFT_282186 [Lipomyces tetrasporus]